MTQEELAELAARQPFVVQFQVEAERTQARCTGRVAHVVSGQAIRFQSLEDLLAFFPRMLLAVRR